MAIAYRFDRVKNILFFSCWPHELMRTKDNSKSDNKDNIELLWTCPERMPFIALHADVSRGRGCAGGADAPQSENVKQICSMYGY